MGISRRKTKLGWSHKPTRALKFDCFWFLKTAFLQITPSTIRLYFWMRNRESWNWHTWNYFVWTTPFNISICIKLKFILSKLCHMIFESPVYKKELDIRCSEISFRYQENNNKNTLINLVPYLRFARTSNCPLVFFISFYFEPARNEAKNFKNFSYKTKPVFGEQL